MATNTGTVTVEVPWHLSYTAMVMNMVASFVAINVGRSTIARYKRWTQGIYQGIIAPDYILRCFALYYVFVTVFNLQAMLKPENQVFTFDPYATLGVSAGATIDVVKAACRAGELEHHPDKEGSDPSLYEEVLKAKRALTDEAGIANYKEFGHPDGPIVLGLWSALPSVEGWTGKLAYGFGVVTILFLLFAFYAWWSNRRHQKQEQRSIGILQQDIQAMGQSMSAKPDCLLALIKNPALSRSLANMRLNKMEATAKTVGKDLASMQVLFLIQNYIYVCIQRYV